MNHRAEQTRHVIRVYRQVGVAKRPRKVMPRQLVPRTIEREYARVIRELVREIHAELALLLAEIPSLVASAALDRRVDNREACKCLGPGLICSPCRAIGVKDYYSHLRTDAGEGKKIRELADQARDNLKAKINPTRLEAIAEKFGKRTTDFQKEQLKKQVKAALGVDVLAKDTKLGTMLEGFVQENVALIKGMPEKIIGDVENAISRGVQRGVGAKEIAAELSEKFDIDENRAKRIARDQVGTLYGQINAARQKELGITRFIWRTVGDEAVRETHDDREGKIYSYDDPPDGELPGEPINCRCSAEPVFSDILGGDDD